MKILMLSEDPNILDRENEAAGRMRDYAALLGELHAVVPYLHGSPDGDDHLFLYPSKTGVLRSLSIFLTVRKLCKKHRFDALTVQAADDIGLAGFFAARIFNIPFQLQVHTDILSPWYRKESWKDWIKYRTALFLIPRADSIRVVSKRIRNSLMHNLAVSPEKIIILPVFTDLRKFTEAKRNPEINMRFNDYEFKMAAVGRFVEKEKNFLMLIAMMREFVRICPNALLVIVGEGPDKNKYEAEIEDYKLKKNIILEPWRIDLPEFYKSFDLFLLSSNYEGWGRAVLEAMASGLPVVMTDVGLAGEVVNNNKNGRIVPAGDTRALLGAVTELYRNPAKRKQFAETGRQTVKNLEPKNKEEYLKMYRESMEFCKK